MKRAVVRHRRNKIMFRKIITYFLILAVVLPILASTVPLGVGVNRAQAADATKFTSSNGEVYDPCGWSLGAGHKGGIAECWSYGIVNLLYDFVLGSTIWIAGLAGNLFNASIQFSLTGKVFDASENGNTMIKDGWTLVRDLLNLVFIFILLFAAISTILQYGNMDIKKILPSLIVVALLVNFSMMITKMVIDASHIFAWEFYNQIDVKNEKKLGNGEMFANMKNDINVSGDFEKKNLANVFIAGFNPQELLTGKEEKEGGNSNKSLWKQKVEEMIDKGESISGVWWQMGLIILLESALALFAGFILLAGAIMFIARVVVLWLVMIFSPIAFLGMVLPSMEKYSKMWWGYLIGQSFFAPAFLFMFMLVTKFINSDFVDSIFKASAAGTSDSMIVLGINGGTIALTFFHFFVVGGLMMACLIVAKQMGGKTAEFGISGAHRIKGWALGGAKKLAWSPTRYGLRLGGGWLADKTLDEEKGWGKKRWAKTLTSIPGVGIGLRKLGTMKKADEDKARKAAEKYAGTLSKAGIASLKRDIEETKGVKGFAQRFIYTGPEGAFAPGKEGYQNIMAKKKSEEDEKIKYRKKLAELANYKDDRDSSGNIIKGRSKEDKVKYMLDKGQRKELDEEIENITKKIVDAYKKAAEVIEDRTTTTAVDLTEKNSRLYKAIEDGESVSVIEAIKRDIINLEKNKNKFNGQKTVMEKKRKEREDKEKAVEKYEAKQDTEKLGAKFSSSGAGAGGGGGGSKGGGGKTTP